MTCSECKHATMKLRGNKAFLFCKLYKLAAPTRCIDWVKR